MPNVVKASKQHRMIVVRYRPGYRAALIVALVMIIFGAGAGGVYYGRFDASREQVVTSADNQRLEAQLVQLRQEAETLRARVAISDRTSMMDQRANEEVQSTLSSLRQQVMQLEQDITFYRQAMSPETAESGLVITEMTLTSTEQVNVYRYKAVFRQAGAEGSVLEGSAEIKVVGTRDGETVAIPIQELMIEPAKFEGKLRFRYFQNLEGVMQIPPDFTPGQIEIKAESNKPREGKIERNFSWKVVEG